jgi:hypothetical protein
VKEPTEKERERERLSAKRPREQTE